MTEIQIKLLTVEVAILALFVSLTAVLLSYISARLSIRSKQIDTIFQDHKLFDELQAVRTQLKVAEAGMRVGEEGAWTNERLAIEVSRFFDQL